MAFPADFPPRAHRRRQQKSPRTFEPEHVHFSMMETTPGGGGAAPWTHFFIQEIQICGTLIFDVALGVVTIIVISPCGLVVLPFNALVVIVVFIIVIQRKVALLGDLLTVYIISADVSQDLGAVHKRFWAAGSVWNNRTTPCKSRGQPCCTLVGISSARNVKRELIATIESFLS